MDRIADRIAYRITSRIADNIIRYLCVRYLSVRYLGIECVIYTYLKDRYRVDRHLALYIRSWPPRA